MSDRATTALPGGEDFLDAETVMSLTPDRPLIPEAVANPVHSRPFQMAPPVSSYPHENRKWPNARSAVFANGDPPAPPAPNMAMTRLLTLAVEFARLCLPRGRLVVFRALYPLNTEERDPERDEGVEELFARLEADVISLIGAVIRPNLG